MITLDESVRGMSFTVSAGHPVALPAPCFQLSPLRCQAKPLGGPPPPAPPCLAMGSGPGPQASAGRGRVLGGCVLKGLCRLPGMDRPHLVGPWERTGSPAEKMLQVELGVLSRPGDSRAGSAPQTTPQLRRRTGTGTCHVHEASGLRSRGLRLGFVLGPRKPPQAAGMLWEHLGGGLERSEPPAEARSPSPPHCLRLAGKADTTESRKSGRGCQTWRSPPQTAAPPCRKWRPGHQRTLLGLA